MLRLQQVEKSFKGRDGGEVPVLRGIDLHVAPGEQVALAGPSGSGKSTLLNLIAGIVSPTGGEVWVCGQEIHKLPEPQRDRFRAMTIGYVFQNFNLLPGFTALENVVLALTFAGSVGSKEQYRRATDLLERMSLDGRLHHRPGELSRGEQQRVAIARALANGPAVLLADEPTASLDHATAQSVIRLLIDSCQEQNVTLLLASHDREILPKFDRKIELRRSGGKEDPRVAHAYCLV